MRVELLNPIHFPVDFYISNFVNYENNFMHDLSINQSYHELIDLGMRQIDSDRQIDRQREREKERERVR